MKNSLDLLLAIDTDKIKRPTKEVEIKRLSELTGGRVVFSLQSLTTNEHSDVMETCTDSGNINRLELQKMIILKGVTSPDFKDKSLLEKFDVPTPKALIEKLLLPGEIVSVYNEISELSGFSENAVSELKNA